VDGAPEQPHGTVQREVGKTTGDRARVGNADTEERVSLAVPAPFHPQRAPEPWNPLRLGCLLKFTPERVDAAVG
jgi:hypothetical protein